MCSLQRLLLPTALLARREDDFEKYDPETTIAKSFKNRPSLHLMFATAFAASVIWDAQAGVGGKPAVGLLILCKSSPYGKVYKTV